MGAYQIKITLKHAKPPVWRRVLLPEKASFYHLHLVIQAVFGWENMHLHDFSFPGTKWRIVPEDAREPQDQTLPEDGVAADDFLDHYKSVRYTYDYGDAWTHKIVVEKELPLYDKRYAMLAKAAGDHFKEDSGGIFGSGTRIPCDIDGINEKLKTIHIPETETSDDLRHIFSPVREQAARNLKRMIRRELGKMKEEERLRRIMAAPSELDRMGEEWEDFYDLLFIGRNKKDTSLVTVEDSSLDIRAMFREMSIKEAGNYAKYLRIPHDDGDKPEILLQKVADLLQAHPEYLRYAFEKKELLYLQKALAKKRLLAEDGTGYSAVRRGMMTGLLRIYFEGDEDNPHATVSFARDAAITIGRLLRKDMDSAEETADRIMRRINAFLMVYGVVETDVLYKAYRAVFDEPADKEDFLRFLYWAGNLNGAWHTGQTENFGGTVHYCILPGLSLHDTIRFRDAFLSKRTGYKKIDPQDIINLSEGNMLEVYGCWGQLGGYFMDRMDEETLGNVLMETYVNVLGGTDVTSLIDDGISYYAAPQSLFDWTDVWCIAMSCAMETGIARFRGYSRREFPAEAKTKKEKEALALLSAADRTLDAKPEKHIHIHRMSYDTQMSLYAWYDIAVTDRIVPEDMVRFVRSHPHPELSWLLAKTYIEAGQYEKAVRELEKMRPLLLDKSDIDEYGLIMELTTSLREGFRTGTDLPEEEEGRFELFTESEDDESFIYREPFIREEKKIRPNAPCPCGSGKKYKACHGRKQ